GACCGRREHGRRQRWGCLDGRRRRRRRPRRAICGGRGHGRGHAVAIRTRLQRVRSRRRVQRALRTRSLCADNGLAPGSHRTGGVARALCAGASGGGDAGNGGAQRRLFEHRRFCLEPIFGHGASLGHGFSIPLFSGKLDGVVGGGERRAYFAYLRRKRLFGRAG
ncbi:unnamed protein product, partial [Ectocarpus sp. 4 AP-2014]